MRKIFLFVWLFPTIIWAQDVVPWIPPISLQSMNAYTTLSAINAYTEMLDDEKNESADDKTQPPASKEKVNLAVKVSSQDVDAAARQLSKTFPAANQTDAISLYKQLYDVYAKEDENPRTINGAMAIFAVGSYVAFQNRAGDLDKLGKDLDVVADQFERGMRKDPSLFKKATPEEIKSAYLQMIMLGMQMMLSVSNGEQGGMVDPQTVARQKEAGRRNLETMFKIPAEKVIISSKGLSFRK